ncbi:MAG: Gfo/Idh/MocA family protein [Thermoguttaceae bacterium]
MGINGMGAGNLSHMRDENIIAICDIDDNNLERTGAELPNAKRFFDFRTLFDEVKDIDAAVITTPDHTHAVATIAAMKRGIHCYTEKPLAHDVAEIRAMQKLAKEKKLLTQMGIVIHSSDNYRRVVELIQADAIGEVQEVHVWCNKGWGNFPHPKNTEQCPPHIHWDQWIGPCEMIPYDPCYLPASWRSYWEFGTGTFGDMACHLMDLPFWALDLQYPISIEATCPNDVDPIVAPLDVVCKYVFEQKRKDGTTYKLPFTWYDGEQYPEIIKEKQLPQLGMGIIFVGKNGILQADYGQIQLFPEKQYKDYVHPKATIPSSPGQHSEWLNAIKNGKPLPQSEFQYAGRLSEAVQLGSVSLRAGKKLLLWDAENMKVTNVPEANRFIAKTNRKGWEIENL